jgi:hypothetical protein
MSSRVGLYHEKLDVYYYEVSIENTYPATAYSFVETILRYPPYSMDLEDTIKAMLLR